MKSKLIKSVEMLNPLYDQLEAQKAKTRGESYDTPVVLTLPVDHILDGPDVWMQCMPDIGNAVPADEECAKTLAAKMNDSQRKETLALIRRLQQPDVRKQLGKSDLAWLQAMEEWHEDELTEATLL